MADLILKDDIDSCFFRFVRMNNSERSYEMKNLNFLINNNPNNFSLLLKRSTLVVYNEEKDQSIIKNTRDDLRRVLSSSNLQDSLKMLILFQIACLYLDDGNVEKSTKIFEDLVQKGKGEAYGYGGLSILEKWNRNFAEEVKLLRKGIELSKRGTYIHYMCIMNLGSSLYKNTTGLSELERNRNRKESILLAKETMEIWPKKRNINNRIGEYYNCPETLDLEKSLEYYAREISIDPNSLGSLESHRIRSRIFRDMKNYEKSLFEINKAIEIKLGYIPRTTKSRKFSLYHYKGRILEEMGNIELAQDFFVLCLEESDGEKGNEYTFAPYHNSLSFLYRRMKEGRTGKNRKNIPYFGSLLCYGKIFKKYFKKLLRIKFTYDSENKKKHEDKYEHKCKKYRRWMKLLDKFFEDKVHHRRYFSKILRFCENYRFRKVISEDLEDRFDFLFENFENSKLFKVNQKVFAIPSFVRKFGIL